jgi:hypothetical protein
VAVTHWPESNNRLRKSRDELGIANGEWEITIARSGADVIEDARADSASSTAHVAWRLDRKKAAGVTGALSEF